MHSRRHSSRNGGVGYTSKETEVRGGGLLLRGTVWNEGVREGTEREGIPPPQSQHEWNKHYARSTQPCIPPGSLNRVSASAGGKGGNVTFAGWQVTLCDPMWHVSSRSGVATLRTAIHLLLTYW